MFGSRAEHHVGTDPAVPADGARASKTAIVGMEATATGLGYEFVADDGGIFTYGDAQFFGSMGSIHGTPPVVGLG
jgi:hypothetical protein